MNRIMDLVNKGSLKKSIPDIKTGDVVRVSQKITEGAKSRIQVFEGMVIARDGGNMVTASITVRKIASGVGVEKKFLLNSPNIEGIKVLRSSKMRRKKAYFLRGLTGKAAKLKEKQRKIMEEIGLKPDEIIETAETTEELAPAPAEENQESEIKNQEEKEEIVEEAKMEEIKEPEIVEKAVEAVEEQPAVGNKEEPQKDEGEKV